MADNLGLKRASLSSYERNRNVPPSDILSKIADILHTSTDYLLGKTETPLPAGSAEREFVESLELDDESLVQQFAPTLDGEALTPEQLRLAAAFLRTIRSSQKQ